MRIFISIRGGMIASIHADEKNVTAIIADHDCMSFGDDVAYQPVIYQKDIEQLIELSKKEHHLI